MFDFSLFCILYPSFFTILTKDEVLDQFEFILLLVLQHSLEVFLPAGDVDWMYRLIHHLSWRRLALSLTC